MTERRGWVPFDHISDADLDALAAFNGQIGKDVVEQYRKGGLSKSGVVGALHELTEGRVGEHLPFPQANAPGPGEQLAGDLFCSALRVFFPFFG